MFSLFMQNADAKYRFQMYYASCAQALIVRQTNFDKNVYSSADHHDHFSHDFIKQ